MATSLTDDCCDNKYVHEILEFRTPRVLRLFPGWTRSEVITLVGRVALGGVSVVSERGVLLALRRAGLLHVFAILGERGFLADVSRVWHDLFPEEMVTGTRRGRVRLFALNERKILWDLKK